MCSPTLTAGFKRTVTSQSFLKTCVRTQLTVFRAPEGIEVPFAVHYHTEFRPTGHFGDWLAVVHYLERKDSRLSFESAINEEKMRSTNSETNEIKDL